MTSPQPSVSTRSAIVVSADKATLFVYRDSVVHRVDRSDRAAVLRETNRIIDALRAKTHRVDEISAQVLDRLLAERPASDGK